MKISYFCLFMLLMFTSIITAFGQSPTDECAYFYKKLKTLPNEKIDYQKGMITFSWDKKEHTGCEITFISTDSLMTKGSPLFRPDPDNNKYLYQQGWRSNKNYSADGPGTTLYGIEKNNLLCLISERQPAYIDDSGETVQQSKVTVTVECIEQEKE